MTLPMMVNVIGSVAAVGLLVVVVVALIVAVVVEDAAVVVVATVVVVAVVVSIVGEDNSTTTKLTNAQKSSLYDTATWDGFSSTKALTSIFGSGPLQQSVPCPNSSHQHANVGWANCTLKGSVLNVVVELK